MDVKRGIYVAMITYHRLNVQGGPKK